MIKKKKSVKSKKVYFYQDFVSQDEIDFHKFGPLTGFDIEKLLCNFLEDCYVAKLEKVLVITGKGNIVRPAVNKLLKQNKYVQSFKSAGYFNGQSGAFEVELKG